LEDAIRETCLRAHTAARRLAIVSTERKNAWLRRVAAALQDSRLVILAASSADVDAARKAGLSDALVDRLALDEKRIAAIAKGVVEIADQKDPIGEIIERTVRPNGLVIRRVRVPLGVIAMVYEARPNVTVEAAALCVKAGNAVVLRPGSDAQRTNEALFAILGRTLDAEKLPREAVQGLPHPSRDAIRVLVQQEGLIDLAIPRGGEALVRFVAEHARVPVVQHFKGVCHVFVDEGADLDSAIRIVTNAKLSRPGVCNALECLLVAEKDAARVLPLIARALAEGGCEIRGDERTLALVPGARKATDDDWGREFLDAILAVRVVSGIDEALGHVGRYGSGHTEAILTKNEANAARWRNEVDAACVVVNASTRFHDGGELGLGAEIGIATSRLHWRGPMGLESLTTMKWIVDGEGQIRS
jgi:glutamate-5-semialdehyde dehydrogenase